MDLRHLQSFCDESHIKAFMIISVSCEIEAKESLTETLELDVVVIFIDDSENECLKNLRVFMYTKPKYLTF